MFFFDPLYLLFSLPALLLGLWAQMKVQGAFNEFSRVRTITGVTGAQVARRILDSNGLRQVVAKQVDGFLSDHYDPHKKMLRLSSQVYQSNSLAAVGVAAHEVGHALQDQQGYAALQLRSAMVPSVQIGSWLGPIIFIVGFLMAGVIGQAMAWVGLLFFAATTAFALVTLPVEFDASRRAKQLLVSHGIIAQPELPGIDGVLDAAALTYVAAAVQAISTLLYYGFLLLGRRQEEV